MDYRNKKVKIINLDGWQEGSDKDYLEFNNYIGQTGTIEYDSGSDSHRFILKYDDKHIDMVDKANGELCFRLENIELLDDTYIHSKQPKPPLRVTPKNIFEWHRVIELCRALHEYSLYEDVDQNLMIKWADELNDRLYGLKGDLQ